MSDSGTPSAVLFDVDGTLVDSNYLHVDAWVRAFADVGLTVEAWRVHRCIGMDGALLMDTLSGGAGDDIQKQLSQRHTHHYRGSVPLLTALPGAQALLRRIADAGVHVVLASSAPEDELRLGRDVLSSDEFISAFTSSHDVDTAKPQPDIIDVALSRAGVGARDAVFVGDAVWDMEAAGRAGVTAIGLRSGGVGSAELESAGAEVVFDNPADLLSHLADSPIGPLLGR